MCRPPLALRALLGLMVLTASVGQMAGCFATHGIHEITVHPYQEIYRDDSTARFANEDDTVFIEVRRAPITQPLKNLAVHYRTLFPGGKPIRQGDKEQYVKLNDKTAYKVTFVTKHVRHRKRLTEAMKEHEIPPGWSKIVTDDPATGKAIAALKGPAIPREQVLYLVQGDKYLYYIFMRADGDSVVNARETLRQFIQNGIAYQ